MNTENRQLWYEYSEKWEKYFCDKIAPLFNLNAIINPEKRTIQGNAKDSFIFDVRNFINIPFQLKTKLEHLRI